MEMVIFVKAGNLEEVNQYLAQGWKVKSISAVPGNEESTYSAYAYFVLVK